MTREVHTGRCSCGAVKFKTVGKLANVVFCHCSQCRRQTGHYFASTSVEDSDLTIEGEENVSWFQSSPEAKRGFCKVCGSGLFWKGAKNTDTSILAGGFDEPSGLKAGMHIFVADKASYYKITDGLTCHESWPQGS